MALPETVAQGSRNPGANQQAADRAHGRGAIISMKCPNKLCEHGIEGSPATCPRCSIPLPGGVLADRFSLEKIARVTDYTITFVAFDRERTTESQVRVYIPRFGRGAQSLKSEIKALKEMHFEGLPRILDFNWDTDFPWVAEDKVAGTSMVGRLVGRDRPLAEPELVGVMLEAARILEKLHTLHIFHRDIRPESLYNRDADNRLMLGTPGWEREFHDKSGAGKKKGVTVYTAPETASGRATPQADLYSLGVSALHLITGLNPEGLYNAASRLFQWQRAVKVSPRLAEILDGLVAPAPGDRIQTAGRLVQLLEALDREHGGVDTRQQQDEAVEPGRKAQSAGAGAASGTAAGAGKAAVPVAAGAAVAAAGAAAGGSPGSPAAAGDPTGAQGDPTRGSANASWGGLRKADAARDDAPRERSLKKIVAAMAAALLALLGVVAALFRKLWEASLGHVLGAHGAKVLVALGLATGTALVAGQLGKSVAPSQEDKSAQVEASTRSHGLPEPLVGHDDQAIPTDPDFHAIAQAQGPLPDPALLRRWLEQQIAARERAMAAARKADADRAARTPAGYGNSPLAGDGFAFSDGTRPEVSRTLSLYSSIFPWQGRRLALGSAQAGPNGAKLSEVSAAELLAANTGLPTSLAAIDTARGTAGHPGAQAQGPRAAGPHHGARPGGVSARGGAAHQALDAAGEAIATLLPPEGRQTGADAASGTRDEAAGSPEAAADTGRSPKALAAGSPYDKAAEPGYDPSDSSGLSNPVSPYFIRVNKTYRTLTLYREGQYAAQFPITIGKGPTTPDGRFTIANKVVRPDYEGIPGGDPRNPLGSHWLGLDVAYPGGKAIGLHGTNDPGALGQAQSGGCIRLRNEDVRRIYDLVPTGTPVEII